MRTLFLLALAIGCVACTEQTKQKTNQVVADVVELAEKKDELISVKTFYKKEGELILYYHYPYLNQNEQVSYDNFNSYLKNECLQLNASVKERLDTDSLSCEASSDNLTRIKRSADFKVYKRNADQLSLLIFKTNYYDDPYHNSFIFKGINYDLKKGTFIGYEDLFQQGSQDKVLAIINHQLQGLIKDDIAYGFCNLLTKENFEVFKDNFVLDADTIKFYFDDCTICPSYSRNHNLVLPIEKLKDVWKSE